LPQKKNLDWLFNDSVPAVEGINLEFDEAQMVNWKRESEEVVMIIFMILLPFICRSRGNLRESLSQKSQLVVEGCDSDTSLV
jgi:hypothetical protein